ncbi:MAG TPA: DUF2721 domain-containing protein [Sphingobacteriaceae bacterium]
MNDLSQTLNILSAMITPGILIMASSSLILATSQRLSRSIERTRKLTVDLRELIKGENSISPSEEMSVLFQQLGLATRRARLLQRALTVLYFTLFFFISTCVSIAVIYIGLVHFAWIPVASGLSGAVLLFYASLILIRETRLALAAVDTEMDHAVRLFQKNFPEVAAVSPPQWWKNLLFHRRGKHRR